MAASQKAYNYATSSKLVRLILGHVEGLERHRTTARIFADLTTTSVLLAWIVLAAAVSPLSGQPVRVHLWVKSFYSEDASHQPRVREACSRGPRQVDDSGPHAARSVLLYRPS